MVSNDNVASALEPLADLLEIRGDGAQEVRPHG